MKNPLTLLHKASPEFLLIAACCRWPHESGMAGAVHLAMQQPIQWPRVLFLAQRHRVGGLVANALVPLEAVPAEVRRALNKARHSMLLAGMRGLRTQLRLKELLEQHHLPFAVLKGLPLTMQAYGDMSLRQSRDIDLLVRERDVPDVDEQLLQAGYRRTGLGEHLSAEQQQLWIGTRKHYEYINAAEDVRLEVHWRTTDNRYLLPMDDPLSRTELAEVAAGALLPVLSRDELLLDLCVHGAGHAWFRMKWIADVAALLSVGGPQRQRSLLTVARQHGLERPVLQALHLCHALFDLPLVNTAEQTPMPVRHLLRIAAAALLEEDLAGPTVTSDFVPSQLALSQLLLRTGWRYRAEELRSSMVSPSDWQQIALPSGLAWMYPLLRLPLWCKRRWFDPKHA